MEAQLFLEIEGVNAKTVTVSLRAGNVLLKALLHYHSELSEDARRTNDRLRKQDNYEDMQYLSWLHERMNVVSSLIAAITE